MKNKQHQHINLLFRPYSTALAYFSVALGMFIGSWSLRSQAAETLSVPARPAPFVYLREIDPTIIQDIRYAGADNFTGRPVPGYDAAECLLLRPVAEALARVQKHIRAQSLSLKVYDCYRPERAVRAFVAWAETLDDDGVSKRFYPNVNRSDLLLLHYIAGQSGHSRGNAVDLTLVELPEPPVQNSGRTRDYAPCNASAGARTPDTSVDMGTGFDCFDTMSYTSTKSISTAQHRWRERLLAAMARESFANYAKEWWHYSFSLDHAAESFDMPIAPLQSFPQK